MSCSRLPAAALLLLSSGCVFSSERPPDVDVKADVASAFLFRGQVMTDRPVLQPSLGVNVPVRGGGVANLSAWGNLDLDDSTGQAWFDDGHAGEFTQVDLTAAYARNFGPVAVTAGVVQYTWNNGESFPFGDFPATAEVFASASTEVLGVVPSVELHYDIDEVEGLYARAALDYQLPVAKDLALLLRGGIGWSDDKHSFWLYRTASDAFADATVEATLVWNADEVTAVHAGVRGSTIVDDGLRDWFRPRVDADNIWYTLGVSWAF